ncbi:hypothetical protein EDC04DRAFT_2898640 [Pisolithus marmoratus]|nr:hypothetical protein EDC04DRAFT_2898640 [Pisolithus marmoratus]
MAPLPLVNSPFILDSAGVAGLLGGDEAVSTVALTQICGGRSWLGWYNSPGSYVVGKRFQQLARSARSTALRSDSGRHKLTSVDPTLLFEHDGLSKGPAYKGIYSGTSMQATGPLAYLLTKKSAKASNITIEGRTTHSVNVSITRITDSEASSQPQVKLHQRPRFLALLPIAASVGTCVTCGFYRQWYAFSMILLGILARGLTCLFIGCGKLVLDHPRPAKGSPNGDGILGSDEDFILLKGSESVINAATRGKFFLRFPSKHARRMAELCSTLLIVQAIAQLIFIPQGQLFGKLMFVISLICSGAYNLWLSSVDKGDVEETILESVLGEHKLYKFELPNRCSAVVFMLLVFNDGDEPPDPRVLKRIMNAYLPLDSPVWEKWKEIVIDQLKHGQALQFDDSHWNHKDFSEGDRQLLQDLLEDAEVVYNALENNERLRMLSRTTRQRNPLLSV